MNSSLSYAEELQRRRAARKGQEVRSHRARVKRLISQGRITLEHVLISDKQHLYTMPVRELLMAVPGMGATKVNRTMNANRLGYGRRFENVPMRQRFELLDWLDEHYPRVVVR